MEPKRVGQLVRQNDQAAQRELFEAFYHRTYAVVYTVLRSRESAEDITQDAFIKAFQNMGQLREPEKFGAWLAVIASNLARNYLKREKKVIYCDELPVLETVGANDTEEQAVGNLEVEQMRRALRALPPDQYQVIILQYYFDLKIDEIAALLKLNEGTVKSRLFRARAKLSRILEPFAAADGLTCKGGAGGNAAKSQPFTGR
ncbi:MAG TPA: RNA polymerase sigma factor [Bacillota bacterium]|nr:RNA polymerase sigma factor [Bacillota bacterium]